MYIFGISTPLRFAFAETFCHTIALSDGCFRFSTDPAASLCAEIGGYSYDIVPSWTACRIADPAYVSLWKH